MPAASTSSASTSRQKGLERTDWADLLVVIACAVFVVVAVVVGKIRAADGVLIHAGAAPFQGNVDFHLSWWSLGALAVAVLVVWAARRWTHRFAWPHLVGMSMAASLAWLMSLTLVDDWGRGFAERLSNPYDYLTAVPRIVDFGEYLTTFTESIPAGSTEPWATHVSSHPPGAVIPFWLLDQVGLSGSTWAATLCVLVGASAAGAVLVAVRALGDEPTARRLAPFIVLSPAALWLGVSGDALFVGVSAWAIALVSLGCRRTHPPRSDAYAFAGGVLLGLGPFLSYGLVLILGIAGLLLVLFGSQRTWAATALGLIVAPIAFTVAGFNWWQGYQLVVDRYYQAWGGERPYSYWVWANLAVFVVVIGPAAVVGIRRIIAHFVASPRTSWTESSSRASLALVFGALLAVGVATLGGLSKGEVERIWLPFALWTIVACSAIPRPRAQTWLIAQAVTALLLQHLLVAPW